MGLEIENIRYAHEPGHTDVCYGKDNRQIFTCGSDGYVRIWNGPDDDDASSNFVADQALSVVCNEEYYLVATNNNYVQQYTYSDKKRDKIMFRFSAPVTHVTVSCSGKFIAACSCDMEIQVIEVETNKITTFTGHTAPVLGVSIDPLDEYLVSSSCDGSIKIWNLNEHSLIKTISSIIPKTNDFFKAVVLARVAWKTLSGSLLAVPKGLVVNVYKRNSWEELYQLASNNIEKELSAVLFSPCGNYIAAASIIGEVVIWEIKHKSMVCYYQDFKKVGISGMVWHPDGSKILFCDRQGRFGIITGINEEISKHSVPIPKNNELSNDDLEDYGEIVDANSLFDDDENDENCISIEKIKSSYKNLSDDDNDRNPTSPVSSTDMVCSKKPIMSLSEPQPPFQPSSTPVNFEPRCLCYNDIGMVRYYDSDRTIDIQFHDSTFHHSLFLRSFGVCTLASLSLKTLCLAVPSIEDNLSKLTCLTLGSWAGNKEWTVQMPPDENIMALATSGNWVAAASSKNYLRIFSHAGTQKQVLSLPGPVVSMTGYDHWLLIVYHAGMGLSESQNLGFIMYEISTIHVKTTIPAQPLPISPKSTLTWLGFTDEGTPSSYDSEGIFRVLGHDYLHWMVICDTKNVRKSFSDHYFIVGLNETNQSIRCILCRNSNYPLVINNPTVVEITWKMPLCEMNDPKSISEEMFWRLMFSIYKMQKIALDANEIFKNFELPMKQAVLKLFGDACNNSDDLRAVDLATFMTKKPLDIAIQYASSQGKTYLIEKLKQVKPTDWSLSYPDLKSPAKPINVGITKIDESNFNYDSEAIFNSQQDIFEDSSINREDENQTSYTKAFEAPVQFTKTGPNPFRKTVEDDNNLKGLKYFDSLTKDALKQNKPFNLNKPLKVKLSSNKEKIKNSKPKKPTFVEWFSKRKSSLSEEYPNISSSELTKLGMKIYKEEINKGNNDSINSDLSEPDTSRNKRSYEEETEFQNKKCKNLDDY